MSYFYFPGTVKFIIDPPPGAGSEMLALYQWLLAAPLILALFLVLSYFTYQCYYRLQYFLVARAVRRGLAKYEQEKRRKAAKQRNRNAYQATQRRSYKNSFGKGAEDLQASVLLRGQSNAISGKGSLGSLQT
jgi:hypothetical protein